VKEGRGITFEGVEPVKVLEKPWRFARSTSSFASSPSPRPSPLGRGRILISPTVGLASNAIAVGEWENQSRREEGTSALTPALSPRRGGIFRRLTTIPARFHRPDTMRVTGIGIEPLVGRGFDVGASGLKGLVRLGVFISATSPRPSPPLKRGGEGAMGFGTVVDFRPGMNWHNPVGVGRCGGWLPRVFAVLQPWAGGCNPVGVGTKIRLKPDVSRDVDVTGCVPKVKSAPEEVRCFHDRHLSSLSPILQMAERGNGRQSFYNTMVPGWPTPGQGTRPTGRRWAGGCNPGGVGGHGMRFPSSSVSAGRVPGWQLRRPGRLPTGDTADCQSALPGWGRRLPEICAPPVEHQSLN